MTNFNLNVCVSQSGDLMCNIYQVSAIHPDDVEREILGYFSSKKSADESLKFWLEKMNYTHGRIDLLILHLN